VITLHVVYRLDDPGTATEQWSAYSYPTSIYTSGSTLDEVRAEFREAARFTFGERWEDPQALAVVEHLERPLTPNAYIRTAVDTHLLDRDQVATAMRRSLSVAQQREDFGRHAPTSATGDAVVIACVAEDRLSWIFEQMGEADAVAVAAVGPAVATHQLVWWSFLAGASAPSRTDAPTESLADVGLTAGSTIGDFARASRSATGRTLVDVRG
jgi:hypothetical protein